MNVSHDFGTWVAALLTLCIFSFLYKDNPLYKFAEHLFVGVSAGYYIVLNYWTVLDSNLIQPLHAAFDGSAKGGAFLMQQGDYRALLIIPAILGVLLFTRLSSRIDWMSRWPLAVIIGVYAGLKTTGFAQGDLVAQVQASMQSFGFREVAHAFATAHGHLDAATCAALGDSFNAILFTVGLITSLLYFYYSREHKGALGLSSRIGIAFLMVSFGAGYGYTVMSRISLLIGRFQFLLVDWLHIR